MSLYLIVLCPIQKRKHNDKKHNELDENRKKSYTASMRKVVAVYPKNRSKQTAMLGMLAAFLLLVMVLAQLFGFEDLSSILGYFWGIDEGAALLLGAVLVTVEVFALPALLGMKLSPLMRWCSATFGGLIALYWIVASVHVISSSVTRDSGIFGGKLEDISSLLLPVLSVLLIALLWAYWMSVLGIKLSSRKKNTRKG